uniref:uncharacterized protein LOC120326317 n=1 Tax=Styela clava TaxID=7725 RepID=UPI001939B04E|nr:uncharacterized protein LOC120326317 [Styela clava]
MYLQNCERVNLKESRESKLNFTRIVIIIMAGVCIVGTLQLYTKTSLIPSDSTTKRSLTRIEQSLQITRIETISKKGFGSYGISLKFRMRKIPPGNTTSNIIGSDKLRIDDNNNDIRNVFRSQVCQNNTVCKRKLSLEILTYIFKRINDTRYKIPNVVHYIWFGCEREFDFYHYISMLTSIRNLKPTAIILHSDCEPSGLWWERIRKYQKVYAVFHSPPTKIYEHQLHRVHHQADVARLDILLKWGGIYLDDTVLVVKSFDTLRNYSAVLPFQEHGLLNNGVILSERNSSFLQRWRTESYKDYREQSWAYNSCRYPWRLWVSNETSDIHVEMTSFLPKWDGWKSVFLMKYPYEKNYAIHLWTHPIKRLKVEFKYPGAIKTMDTTFGEIARKALYNTTNFMSHRLT